MHKKTFLTGVLIFTVGFFTGSIIPLITGHPFLGPTAEVPKPKTSDGPEYNNRQVTVTDLVKLFPKLITRQGSPKGTSLALTFDDGPDQQYTPQILNTLKKYQIKATFFVIGNQIQKYPDVFKRIIKEGHEVGIHGFQHLKISELPLAKVNYQLSETNKLIMKYGGPKQTIFRPPYGALDPKAADYIGKKGYNIVLWTIDSLDWRSLKKDQVVKNVVPKLKRGYIVLQHSASETKLEDLSGSVDALPTIIESAKKQGYQFVKVSQILSEVKKQTATGR